MDMQKDLKKKERLLVESLLKDLKILKIKENLPISAIQQIAEETGIHRTTVGRALKGDDVLGKNTLRKVLKLALKKMDTVGERAKVLRVELSSNELLKSELSYEPANA